MFIPLTKISEETRTVYGRAVQGDVVDKSGEVFDYESSKPHFQQWSAEVSAATGGKSLGNVRSMHGNVAAGKLVDIQFSDHEQAIDVAARIVDDQEWKKVLAGVYTGFSIGGRYLKRWPDNVDGQMVQRYTAAPSEISLVDAPCVPTAKFFDVVKSDGRVRRQAFQHQNEVNINMFVPRDENHCGRSTAANVIKAALRAPAGDLAGAFGKSAPAPRAGLLQGVSEGLRKRLASAGMAIRGTSTSGRNGVEGGTLDAIRQIHSGGAQKMSPVHLPPESSNSAPAPTAIHPHRVPPQGSQYATPRYEAPPLLGPPQSASESSPALPPGNSDEYDRHGFARALDAIKGIHRRGPTQGYLR